MNIFSKFILRLQGKLPDVSRSQDAQSAGQAAPDLRLLFFIVDWAKVNIIFNALEEEEAGFHFIGKGRGAAESGALDILGIGASDKAVISCLEQSEKIPVLLKKVQKKFGSSTTGTGITFSVPLSGINSPILRIFNQPDSGKINDYRERRMGGVYAVIFSIVNMGFTDEYMNTARKAGALNGTILNARSQTHEGAVKFFGISVQEEREMIIILTSREKRDSIMHAVTEAHGLESRAQGITFSMPAQGVMNLSFDANIV